MKDNPLPLVYIEADGITGISVYRSENGFQAWSVAQGLLSLDAAAEIALVVGRHTLAALVAAIDAKIADPQLGMWGDDKWDETSDEVKARVIEGWQKERQRLIDRMPTHRGEILVR